MGDLSSEACPLCGQRRTAPFAQANDWEYRTSQDTFHYWRCIPCNIVFLAEPPVTRLREIYPGNYYSYCMGQGPRSWLVAVKEWLDARMFRRILREIPGEDLAVLDVGGGSGWLLSIIRKNCRRVKATHEVDLDEAAGAAARAEGHSFHAMPIEQFHSERPFHLIVMLNLIEHVESPITVLNAMAGLFAPHGRLVIKTPNFDTLNQRLFRSWWGGLHCPRHWVLFTRESLIRVAGECGLDCTEARFTQGGSQWACSILGWLADRGWIRITPQRPLWMHPLFKITAALAAGFDLVRLPIARTDQMIVTLRRR